MRIHVEILLYVLVQIEINQSQSQTNHRETKTNKIIPIYKTKYIFRTIKDEIFAINNSYIKFIKNK